MSVVARSGRKIFGTKRAGVRNPLRQLPQLCPKDFLTPLALHLIRPKILVRQLSGQRRVSSVVALSVVARSGRKIWGQSGLVSEILSVNSSQLCPKDFLTLSTLHLIRPEVLARQAFQPAACFFSNSLVGRRGSGRKIWGQSGLLSGISLPQLPQLCPKDFLTPSALHLIGPEILVRQAFQPAARFFGGSLVGCRRGGRKILGQSGLLSGIFLPQLVAALSQRFLDAVNATSYTARDPRPVGFPASGAFLRW